MPHHYRAENSFLEIIPRQRPFLRRALLAQRAELRLLPGSIRSMLSTRVWRVMRVAEPNRHPVAGKLAPAW
jgi:hypothetical protein